ncbi:hypothetical protein AGMMS49992_07090 [Clostridia bacterium]|nr:hypothetical protein AGMMS49992_07090 [Clostridia bacterium]
MDDVSISEIIQNQKALKAKHPEWTTLSPHYGHDTMLWLVEEIGEVVHILKRNSNERIMDDPAVRSDFVEELADVMMFFNDMLICYGISADEFAKAYRAKHARNMQRVW